MALPFSWSRLGRSFGDAWADIAGGWAVIIRLVAATALVAFGIGASVTPDALLPESLTGRGLLCLLFLMLLAVPVQTAYRLRVRLEELTGLPESDRRLILELKIVAGRAMDSYVGIDLLNPPSGSTVDVEALRRAYAGVRHYPELYRTARSLGGCLRYLASGQGTALDHMKILDPAEEAYKRLMTACDELLTPPAAPPPSKSGS